MGGWVILRGDHLPRIDHYKPMETGIPNPVEFSSLPLVVMRRRLPSPQTGKHFSMNVLLSSRVRKYFLPEVNNPDSWPSMHDL
jgi:hypothetical protein